MFLWDTEISKRKGIHETAKVLQNEVPSVIHKGIYHTKEFREKDYIFVH